MRYEINRFLYFYLFISFIKIDDLENVRNEVDNTINRCHTHKGQIISIEKNNSQYTCQGCGGVNVIHETNVISCNDCHSRLLKGTDINDDCLKITIMTSNHEEYNLKIPKSLITALLNVNNSCPIDDNDCVNNESHLSVLISTNVQFTYSETSGVITEIAIFTEH